MEAVWFCLAAKQKPKCREEYDKTLSFSAIPHLSNLETLTFVESICYDPRYPNVHVPYQSLHLVNKKTKIKQ